MTSTLSKARRARQNERNHAQAVRYFLKTRDYASAARSLAWAMQQSTLADVLTETDQVAKARDAMARAKPR